MLTTLSMIRLLRGLHLQPTFLPIIPRITMRIGRRRGSRIILLVTRLVVRLRVLGIRAIGAVVVDGTVLRGEPSGAAEGLDTPAAAAARVQAGENEEDEEDGDDDADEEDPATPGSPGGVAVGGGLVGGVWWMGWEGERTSRRRSSCHSSHRGSV